MSRPSSMIVLLALGVASACTAQVGDAPSRARTVILFVGDGMGPAQTALAIQYAREVEGRELEMVKLMRAGDTGYALPAPYAHLVTDSAAAATQIATGRRARNESLGLDPDGNSLETVLEWAEGQGLATGLVTNMRLSHATPAAFAAHHVSRYGAEASILSQIVAGHEIEVLVGGGARALVPAGRTVSELLPGIPSELDGVSVREDERDLVKEARERGYRVATDRGSLQVAAEGAERLLAVFAASHLPYVLDREALGLDSVPTLPEMTRAALTVLERSENGFFLMVEGGRIDYAAHDNDAGTMLQEILEFDAAIGVAAEHRSRHPDTLLIVSADHGTGGFSISFARGSSPEMALPAGQTYRTHYAYPGMGALELLGRQTASFELIQRRAGDDPRRLVEEVERATGLVLTLAQARRVLAVNADGLAETDDFTEFFADDSDTPQCLLARALASQTFMVWSTGEHTTEPLLSFGVGPGSSTLRGIYPNTHLFEVIQAALGGGVDP